MKIIGYLIYGIFVVWASIEFLGLRIDTKNGFDVEGISINKITLFIVSLAIVPIFKLSPFHLLWMFPASFILGPLTLLFPLSIISYFGIIVYAIACIGLNKSEIERNKAKRLKQKELMNNENISETDTGEEPH